MVRVAGSRLSPAWDEAMQHAAALFVELSVEDYEAIFRCNYMGVVNTLKAGTAGMLKRCGPAPSVLARLRCSQRMHTELAAWPQAARPHCDRLIPVRLCCPAGPDSLRCYQVCASRLC
jgi:hypothetical protein